MTSSTEQFLEKCKEKGITLVSICQPTRLIASSVSYSRSCGIIVWDSVYSDASDSDGHPLIWDVVHELDISYGCGNGGQHQITSEAASVLDMGVFKLDGNRWIKVDPT